MIPIGYLVGGLASSLESLRATEMARMAAQSQAQLLSQCGHGMQNVYPSTVGSQGYVPRPVTRFRGSRYDDGYKGGGRQFGTIEVQESKESR